MGAEVGQREVQLQEKPSASVSRRRDENFQRSEKMEETPFVFICLSRLSNPVSGNLLWRRAAESVVGGPSAAQDTEGGGPSLLSYQYLALDVGVGAEYKADQTPAFWPEGAPENQKVLEKL